MRERLNRHIVYQHESDSNLGIQFDSQVFFAQGLMNGGQVVVAPTLYSAFPFEVHNHGALLRLEGVVAARRDETLDDMVKRVVVVVEQHDVPFVVQQHVGQDVFLSESVGTVDAVHDKLSLSCRKDSRSCLHRGAWCL